jgi:putative sigma-54 modulation protein
MDQCVHKIEHQLRRYKERVQNHKGDVALGEVSPVSPDVSEPPELA